MRPLVIVGCGGFGREVLALVRAINSTSATWNVLGFVDDSPSPRAAHLTEQTGHPVLGPVAVLRGNYARTSVVIAVGDPSARERVAKGLKGLDLEWPVLVHPSATVSPDALLGEGAVIAPGARISTAVVIGDHVHIDQNATVGHDSMIGDFGRLNPQACVSGSVRVGTRAMIGANATILQGISVGVGSIVGAGAVVTKDVPSSTVVKGVPAR